MPHFITVGRYRFNLDQIIAVFDPEPEEGNQAPLCVYTALAANEEPLRPHGRDRAALLTQLDLIDQTMRAL